MDILDDVKINTDEERDKSIIPVIYKYSVIGAILIIVFSIVSSWVFHSQEKDVFRIFHRIEAFFNFCTYIIILSVAVTKYKEINLGFVTLSNAFKVSYFIGCIMAFVDMVSGIAIIFYCRTSNCKE